VQVTIPDPENGITASLLDVLLDVRWRKASASNPSGSCAELAALPGGSVAMRNSRDPGGPALIFARAEASAFAAGVKSGEFDDLLTYQAVRRSA
jgi:hypothetical protein